MVCVPAEGEGGQVVGTSPTVRRSVAIQIALQFGLQVLTGLLSSTRQSVHSCQKAVLASVQTVAANIIGTRARAGHVYQIEFAVATGIFSTETGCTHVVQVQGRAGLGRQTVGETLQPGFCWFLGRY